MNATELFMKWEIKKLLEKIRELEEENKKLREELQRFKDLWDSWEF